MLGAPSARASRPRAPSRLGSRKSTTNDDDPRRATSTPPPPYDPRSSNLEQLQNVFGESEQRPVTLLGSSVLATAQMLGYELPDKISEVSDNQALQQKSREELFELLRNAETLIRTHETELNLAALAGEALLRENNDLRARHESLAAPTKPPFDSLKAFARPADASSALEQDLVSSAPPTPAAEPATLSSPSTPPRRAMPLAHSKRVSASPEQIAVLNTQNEELQGRLERIVAEATETDRDSKRMLRNLQREIEGLRNELEDTQRRNAELETLAQHRKAKEPAQPRRRTSRAHLQALIEDPPSPTTDGPVRDFAPPKYLTRSSTGRSINAGGSPSLSNDEHFPSSSSSAGSSRSQDGEDDDIFESVSDRSRLASRSAEEFSLLAQILSKVKELEDAKNTISASQRFMQERLDAAARDASEMKQKYDGLQLEEIEGLDENGDTVRFFSWRTGPSSVTVRRITSPTIGDGISTVNLPDSPFLTSVSPHLMGVGNPRPRKFRQPLSDRMFVVSPSVERNDPFIVDREDNERTVRPSPHQKPRRTPPSTLRSAFNPVDEGDTSLAQDDDEGYMTPEDVSFDPEKSTLFGRDAIGTSSESNLAGLGAHIRTRTLDEELGRDFGDSWSARPAQLSFMENSLSASTTINSIDRAAVAEAELVEHPAMAALRQALDPSKTGHALEPGQHILPQGSLASAPVGAFQLLGRAVVARPARWLSRSDGQPKRIVSAPGLTTTAAPGEDPWETTVYSETVDDTACDPEEDQEGIQDESSIDATRLWVDKLAGPNRRNRLANARRRRMSAISRGGSVNKKDEFEFVDASDAETEASDQDLPLTSRLQSKGVAFVVEVWLFLQFVIVLGVFVFVMARKGPRAVLGDPPAAKRR